MTDSAPANSPLPSSTIRSYALIGIVLYVFGFVLNGIGNGLDQLWLVPYADTVSALGFVVAVYTASLAGVSTRLIVTIGVIYGLGTFYLGEPHSTHRASGLGFGLEHSGFNTLSHINIGLGLITFATVLLVALAYYKTRTRRAKPSTPAQTQPLTPT